MATAATHLAPAVPDTFADLLQQIGRVPLERILMHPPPGAAKEADLVRLLDGEPKRLCELVDGVLVEKTMGTREGQIAMILGHLLYMYLEKNDLGTVLGADSPFRLRVRLVRLPDVSFVPCDHLPGGALPDQAIAAVVPSLAVEVLSASNTPAEMRRKLQDYFTAGVRLVWFIDPVVQTARVFTSPGRGRSIGRDGVLDGGDVLPGFRLPLRELFARTERRGGRR